MAKSFLNVCCVCPLPLLTVAAHPAYFELAIDMRDLSQAATPATLPPYAYKHTVKAKLPRDKEGFAMQKLLNQH